MLVETALVAVVLTVIVFGLLEYGLFLRQASTVADATRSGSRSAAFAATDPTADFQIITAMKEHLHGLAGDITKVSIYKADADGNPMSLNCSNFIAVSGECNVYSGSDFDKPSAAIAAQSVNQGGWAPSARKAGVDYVGIRVEAKHNFITSFFGTSNTFHDDGVVRIEASPADQTPDDDSSGFSAAALPVPPAGVTVPTVACGSCGTTGTTIPSAPNG